MTEDLAVPPLVEHVLLEMPITAISTLISSSLVVKAGPRTLENK